MKILNFFKDGRLSSSSSIQTGLNDFVGSTGNRHLTGNGNNAMEQQQQLTAESLAAQNLVNSYVKNVNGYSGYEQLLQLSTNGNYFQDCLNSHSQHPHPHPHHHHISHSNRPQGGAGGQRHLQSQHLVTSNDKDPGAGATDSNSYENNNQQQQQLSPPI
jgi:hypothetical protein